MFFGDVDERLGNVGARVVDEDVEARELGNFGSDMSAVIYVADDGGGVAAGGSDTLRDLLEIRFCAAEKNQFGTGMC